MNITGLFLETFFAGSSISLDSMIPSSSVLSSSLTTTELSATGIGITGSRTLDEEPILGTSSISSALTTASNGLTATSNTYKQLEITQAYIESMDEKELENFIMNLEQLKIPDDSDETNVVHK